MRSYKSNLYVDTFVTVAFYCIYMCMNFVHSCVWQLFLKNKRWDKMMTPVLMPHCWTPKPTKFGVKNPPTASCRAVQTPFRYIEPFWRGSAGVTDRETDRDGIAMAVACVWWVTMRAVKRTQHGRYGIASRLSHQRRASLTDELACMLRVYFTSTVG